MRAFENISDSLSAIANRHLGLAPVYSGPVSTFPDPSPPRSAAGGTNPVVPRTPGHSVMQADSPSRISLHPSVSIEALDRGDIDLGNRSDDRTSPGSPTSSRVADSEAGDLMEPGSLSSFETQLRLVQRDMIRVLKLPAEPSVDVQSDRLSFKRRTGLAEPREPSYPTLPLDRLCVDRMYNIAALQRWTPTPRRAAQYFQFNTNDRRDFLSSPIVPDTATDKLSGDCGKARTKALFFDKTRAKFEDTLKKADEAARFGICINAFLLLLSEYIVYACEHDSPIPADMLAAVFRCLDEVLRLSLDQFTRIAVLALKSRRTNLLEALFIPHEGT